MIHEIDETLRALIRREALNGADVEVTFDAPTKEWAARRNSPTVSVYLYDIREDVERREVEYEEIRDERGRVVSRRPPPRRFRLSYLITAWTQRPEDEHRLLSSVLHCFLRRDTLPDELLAGSLAEQKLPVVSFVGLPPPKDRNLSDVWSALGGELKPSLDLVIVAPFDPTRAAAVGPPVLEEPRINVVPSNGEGNGEPEPVIRRRKKGAKGDAEKTATPQVTEETISGGKENQPGRTLRIRDISGR